MSNHQAQPSGNGPNGPSGGGMGMPPQHQGGPQQQGSGPPPGQNMSQQNLNQIVLEYLSKKGYTRTEHVLREESTNVDKEGRPVLNRTEDQGAKKYDEAFVLLATWVDQNLDIYKFELRRLLWPIFVYSYLELITTHCTAESQTFLESHRWRFDRVHADELRTFETISLPKHVADNTITKLYMQNKYRLPLNTHVYFTLIAHLEANANKGGTVIINLLQNHCQVSETKQGPVDLYSFEAIISRARGSEDEDACTMPEGIEGVFTGVTNLDLTNNNAPVRLGPLQMEEDLATDVRAELQDEDAKNPPAQGQSSLLEIFNEKIKREESADAIPRTEVPLPPSIARDVVMEVQKIKENRDRFKIESRTGGVGPAVSVCMFTFHNTLDALTCIEFSDDEKLIATGTQDSYIQVWSLTGEALKSLLPRHAKEPPTNSRRLIGHSAPAYKVSFSPSIDSPSTPGQPTPSTNSRLLLSCSSDKTIRLWSLETWTQLIVYKGHDGPVWDVKWGPFGYYFATCGWDKTVRVWSQDHISYLRMMVGHDSSVNRVAWHPNGAYVFSASDEVDKTVRMWSVTTGQCVRIFTGHTEYISALECSKDGKTLASADTSGTIYLWDLAKGTLLKRCRGHGRGGIWSLSFSAESTVLTSGGADGTVRIWDVNEPTDPSKNGDGEVIGTGGQAEATRINGAAAGPQASTSGATAGAGSSSKKKGKETVITPDQITAFPTKKTPVKKVKFTRMNLVLVAGCYQG